MSRNRTRSVLARAALAALTGAATIYQVKPEEEPGGGGDVTPEKLELTPDELEAKLQEARDAAIKDEREKRKQAEKEKRRRERQERGEDEEPEEDPAEIVRKAEARAATAEQERDEAKKTALLAKVENKLRAYLLDNFKEFVGNTLDIMLHIEKALDPNATEQAIVRLIESHSKAFVERTKAARTTNTNPVVTRSKITGITPERENKTVTREQQPARQFSSINWHG
jgi:hypothetical protein